MSKNSIDLLNIDEIVEQERVVRIGGADYPVVQQSVDAYLKRLKEERKQDTAAEDDMPEKTVLRIVDMISESIPDCPRSKLTALTPEKLMLIVRWLNRADEGAVENEK